MSTAISLYFHIPYCVSKCPYCDFNSYAVGVSPSSAAMTEDRYVEALLSELNFRIQEHRLTGRRLETIFFGGGTPSLFSPDSIRTLIEASHRLFPTTDPVEITLEANPGTIQETLGEERLRNFREAGVNRISMGVQSFHPWKLKYLGRLHSAQDTVNAVENVRAAGFSNFNLDLISGVKGDTVNSFLEELEAVLSFGSPHLSVYSLTIEPGTEFGRLARRGVQLTGGDDLQSEISEETRRLLNSRGLRQYEISNYAKPGFECRHNLQYWTHGEYLGLGAGAHSYLREGDGLRWGNIPGPNHYIARALGAGDASQKREELTPGQRALEFLYVRTRLLMGFCWPELDSLLPERDQTEIRERAKELSNQGLIELDNEGMRLSERGILFADGVVSTLAEAVST